MLLKDEVKLLNLEILVPLIE